MSRFRRRSSMPSVRIWRSYDPFYLLARDSSTWLIALVAVPAGLALSLKLIRPRRPLIIPGRAILLMLLTLAFVPGVLANLVLKEHWGRPRPIDIAQFGGEEHFRPWWDPRGDCPKNCSFIAGEPSGAFWTMAAAAVAPPQWRAPACSCSAPVRHGGRVAAHGGRRPFLHRHRICRRIRFFCNLDRAWMALSLARDTHLRCCCGKGLGAAPGQDPSCGDQLGRFTGRETLIVSMSDVSCITSCVCRFSPA